MKVKIDADTCVGCTLCENICPEVYQMKDNKATVIVDVVPKALEQLAKQGADDCPVSAITVF